MRYLVKIDVFDAHNSKLLTLNSKLSTLNYKLSTLN